MSRAVAKAGRDREGETVFRERHSGTRLSRLTGNKLGQTAPKTRSDDLLAQPERSVLESISKVPHETHCHHRDSARLHEASRVAVGAGPL